MNFKFLKGKSKKIIAVILVLAVAGGGTFAYTKSKASKKAMANVTLPTLATVKTGKMDQRVTASGTTEATDPSSIFIELSQTVDKVYAEVGDKVEEGQLLVTYDIADEKKNLENKLKEAKINLENAKITLNDLVTPSNGSELLDLKSNVLNAKKSISDNEASISSLEASVSKAETEMNDAKKTAENNKELLSVGGVSQKEYDDSVTAYNNAVSAYNDAVKNKDSKVSEKESLTIALEKAEVNLENGTNKLNDSTTKVAYQKQLNAVATAEMNVKSAEDDLSKLTEATYSPISGTIIESNAVEGQMLTDSTVIMKVADLTQLDVTAQVSEYDIANIKVGQNVELTSDGIEGVTYNGTVTKIEPSASSQTTTSGSEIVVPVTVHMTDNDDLVKPGFTFDMEIIVLDMPETTKYIPVSAVQKEKDTDKTYVFEVGEGGTLKKTYVELGTYSDINVELLSGLSDDVQIIESPTDKMTDGSKLHDFATSAKGETTTTEQNSLLGGGMGGGPSGGGGGRSGGGMSGGGPR